MLVFPLIIFAVSYKLIYPFFWKWTSQAGLIQIVLTFCATILISISSRNQKYAMERFEPTSEQFLKISSLSNSITEVALVLLIISMFMWASIIAINVLINRDLSRS